MSTPTIAQLQKAITLAEQIEKLQVELARIVGGSFFTTSAPAASNAPTKSRRGGKRTMSPETILKMKAAQQARWAKKRGKTAVSVAEPAVDSAVKSTAKRAKKAKRNLSPEGRARLAAAMKARWAARKKAAK